mmetsp:Transcript_58797/g.124856  ORF Transcript_58797/g.124856 Transcript_58797/m.124856 type:complete len:248 (+) Transcript_58797:478-1221(+)
MMRDFFLCQGFPCQNSQCNKKMRMNGSISPYPYVQPKIANLLFRPCKVQPAESNKSQWDIQNYINSPLPNLKVETVCRSPNHRTGLAAPSFAWPFPPPPPLFRRTGSPTRRSWRPAAPARRPARISCLRRLPPASRASSFLASRASRFCRPRRRSPSPSFAPASSGPRIGLRCSRRRIGGGCTAAIWRHDAARERRNSFERQEGRRGRGRRRTPRSRRAEACWLGICKLQRDVCKAAPGVARLGSRL